MRILVVQESDWLEKGPHQSHHLMERMSIRGHQVRVIDYEILWRNHNRGSTYSTRQVFSGVRKATDHGSVTVVRPAMLKLPVLEYLSMLYTHDKEIERQIREFKPEIVVCLGILNAALAGRRARVENIPLIYYVIDELHRLVPQPFFRSLARRLESHNMKRAALVMSINEGLREYTVHMGASQDKTSVLKAGVDFGRFGKVLPEERATARKRLGFTENDIVLFFMGWLYNFSGIREIVREMAEGRWRNAPLKLYVVGAGDSWDDINNTVEEKRLEKKVVLEGWKPYAEIPSSIMTSDICIMPSLQDRIMTNIVPIKMYEYMACAKPVIATRFPGLVKEFGNGHGVIYVDHPADVLPCALKLWEQGKIRELGMSSREFVADSNWDSISTEFENTLRRFM